jgi:hypothetical protein
MVVSDSTQRYALVPDSSAVHAVDPQLDGKRLVVGCSREHLAELAEQYKCRPFVAAELWAGKITRVLRQHPKEVSEVDLAGETGLTLNQIRRGLRWQNIEIQRWLEQIGQGQNDGPDVGR